MKWDSVVRTEGINYPKDKKSVQFAEMVYFNYHAFIDPLEGKFST
ncbi:MAG: hypothetical protein ACFFCI_06395 [Promethearchaeota archaeon]